MTEMKPWKPEDSDSSEFTDVLKVTDDITRMAAGTGATRCHQRIKEYTAQFKEREAKLKSIIVEDKANLKIVCAPYERAKEALLAEVLKYDDKLIVKQQKNFEKQAKKMDEKDPERALIIREAATTLAPKSADGVCYRTTVKQVIKNPVALLEYCLNSSTFAAVEAAAEAALKKLPKSETEAYPGCKIVVTTTPHVRSR